MALTLKKMQFLNINIGSLNFKKHKRLKITKFLQVVAETAQSL
jgi:hypothetical protein